MVATVGADKVDPANDGKLIHLTAKATTDETLTDPDFGVSTPAIRLLRKVEMYQFKEEAKTHKQKNANGVEETITDYVYTPVWSEKLIDSSTFKDLEYKNKNPASMPYQSQNWEAKKVTLGAFELSPSLLKKMQDAKELTVSDAAKPPSGYIAIPGGFYRGDPQNVFRGDLRVTFTVIEPQTISVAAKQTGTSFEPYPPAHPAGDPTELLEPGEHTAAEMFQHAQDKNKNLLWALRGVGLFAMFGGLALVFRPLAVLGDRIPIIGNMVAWAVIVVAGGLAVGLTFLTIAATWLLENPLFAVLLLVGGIVALVLVVVFVRTRMGHRAAKQV